MHKPTRTTAASLLLLLTTLAAAPAQSCAMTGPENRARVQQERIDRTKAAALALKEEADLVFVGTLAQLTLQPETVKNDKGHEVVLHRHQAVFDQVDPIKGSYAKGQVLEYTVNKNLVQVRCGSVFRDNVPKENGVTERYLVYARDGKILRTNHIPEHPQVLSGLEEALHLRELP